MDFSQLPANWQTYVHQLETSVQQANGRASAAMILFAIVSALAVYAMIKAMAKRQERVVEVPPKASVVQLSAHDIMFASLEAAGQINERWLQQVAQFSDGNAVYRHGMLLVSTRPPDGLPGQRAPRLRNFVNDVRNGEGAAFELLTPTEGPHGFIVVDASGLSAWLRRFSDEELDKLLMDPQFESRPSIGAAARA